MLELPLSRARLLRRGAGVAAAAVAGGALLVRDPGVARSAASPEQDVRVLNFILELERLEEAFYAQARRRGIRSRELAEFAEVAGEHEKQHVAFLEKALGSAAARPPAFALDDAVRDDRRFSASAVVLEDALVAAYNGQAANLTRKRLAEAATIASVEGRHAAWIRDIVGEPPAPEAVGRADSERQVRRILREQGLLR